ncbi:hypothetical protein [Acuticoccus kandeliae]|uniref:hypothetical protein n=1 Tax=Acuticoccus kandeliae TaxID=2073160 RepID=UPI000D3E7F4A|nr:hypothetical protein [Acuticoccus kandeliae]
MVLGGLASAVRGACKAGTAKPYWEIDAARREGLLILTEAASNARALGFLRTFVVAHADTLGRISAISAIAFRTHTPNKASCADDRR